MSGWFSRVWKVLLLYGLGAFICARFGDGTLLFYVNQRFVPLIFLAALVLIVLSTVSIWFLFDTSKHGHRRIGWSGLALMALPVILGVLVAPTPLGGGALVNRRVTTVGLGGVSDGTTTVLKVDPGKRNVLDWVQAFSQAPDAAVFTGQEATLVGFVYRDEGCDDDHFLLSRFVIVCCVADAVPVGLPVRWPGAADLAGDQWVEVHGTFEVSEYGGETMPILVADRVTPTERPAQPYLYP
jgi:putative membrane protein